ncbi:MAG: VWA domain-containing protein [Caulobacteraceae bacterium]|nr:MAG: VWA domain-containing protein [Caulobacteraceae bacterium]
MTVSGRFKPLSGALLCALIAASSPITPLFAQTKNRPAVRDGEVSPDACGKLGFDAVRRGSGGYSRRMPAPTPPPPPSASPQAGDVSELTIAAQRRGELVQDVPLAVSPFSAQPGQQRMATPAMKYAPSPRAGDMETEKYPGAASNPIHQVAADPVSTFSIDVDTASYANVRRFLTDGRLPPKDAVRVEELVNYFDYGYAAPATAAEPFKAYTAVTPSPWAPGKQIVHIGLQGYDIPRAKQPPLNLVFLIDTSGSMTSEDKLPLAAKAMNILIDQLSPADRVSMVAYAGSAGAVLSPTSGAEKLKMRCALGALQAGGSTAGGEGLALAYALAQQNFRKDAVNRVILLTDGDFNVGVADPSKLKDFVADKRRSGIYLSVYGFGRGNYNDTMMQTLAQNGNGTAGYIDTLEEGRKLFRDDFSGSVFPIADDVKIQVEFNPATVAEYRLIGYETRMLAREDFNNDQVDAGEVGSGVSVTALYEITPAGGPASVDPLRYGSVPSARPGPAGELAFLKIRYKLPGGQASKLIQQPIGAASAYPTLDAAPEATRWAVSVAAYGQTLRGDPWLSPGFGWDRIESLAQNARGKDPDGQRAEFVRLVRAARDGRRLSE